MVRILEPIVKLIISLESNDPQIHLFSRQFNNLENTLLERLPMSPLEKADEKLILDKFKRRKKFDIGPIHLAAEILNPMVQGGDLKPSDLIDGLTFIYELGQQMKLGSIQLKTELVRYREKDGLWGRKILWEGLESMSPLLWWRSLRGTGIIVEVALRILSALATSAAIERTFSAFTQIAKKVAVGCHITFYRLSAKALTRKPFRKLLPQGLHRKAFYELPHRQGLNDKSAKAFPHNPFRKPFRKIDVRKLFINHLSYRV
ncbi:hypothetical protein AVEN_198952-1 [Araneus ventricosus]|uniref:HAT C-terminal dimerisation domain-containing protein n=1 Tax=Araneus ventricosus TaxID=182803 RepID=A0A4Y2P5W4_ARAVE|nr:hypothetical protein AVEN_198952-1 [Araneus ventricosus]